MDQYEFYIRLEEDSLAFVYTIRRAGDLIETGTVSPLTTAGEAVEASAYYGGSQAID
jgi:hypothetical protein